jgi:hypothetical protein
MSFAIARTEFGTMSINTAGSCEGSVRLARTGTTSAGTQGPNLCNHTATRDVAADLRWAIRRSSSGRWSS